MRISDWSSDVGSSDLGRGCARLPERVIVLARRLAFQFERHHARRRVERPPRDDRRLARKAKLGDVERKAVTGAIAHPPRLERQRYGSELASIDDIIRRQLGRLIGLLHELIIDLAGPAALVGGDVLFDAHRIERHNFPAVRSEEHTPELQSQMRISYA